MRFVWRRNVTEAHGQLEQPGLGLARIENRDVPQTHKGFDEEVKTGPDFGLYGVASFRGLLGLKIESDIGLDSAAMCQRGNNERLPPRL